MSSVNHKDLIEGKVYVYGGNYMLKYDGLGHGKYRPFECVVISSEKKKNIDFELCDLKCFTLPDSEQMRLWNKIMGVKTYEIC